MSKLTILPSSSHQGWFDGKIPHLGANVRNKTQVNALVVVCGWREIQMAFYPLIPVSTDIRPAGNGILVWKDSYIDMIHGMDIR
jgi:hypothetical protein